MLQELQGQSGVGSSWSRRVGKFLCDLESGVLDEGEATESEDQDEAEDDE